MQWNGHLARRQAEIILSVASSRWKGQRTVLFSASSSLQNDYLYYQYDLSTTTTRSSNDDHSQEEDGDNNIAVAIQRGVSVICLPHAVNPQKCQALANQCIAVAQARQATAAAADNINTDGGLGLVRLPTQAASHRAALSKTPFVAPPLPIQQDELAEVLLLDVIKRIDAQLPRLSQTLFDTDPSSLTKLWLASSSSSSYSSLSNTASSLIFSSREPAVNVYTTGGEFLPHTDGQTLTLLIPLSTPVVDFEGGGTAFWSSSSPPPLIIEDGQSAGQQQHDEPYLVLTPPAGTALLFGGSVRHAGRPVLAGTRVVLVASFSPCPANAKATTWEELEAREICDSDEYVHVYYYCFTSIDIVLAAHRCLVA